MSKIHLQREWAIAGKDKNTACGLLITPNRIVSKFVDRVDCKNCLRTVGIVGKVPTARATNEGSK